MPKEVYIIEIDRPREITIGEMEAYISEAVGYWGNQCHPDDPKFGMYNHTRRVYHGTILRLQRLLFNMKGEHHGGR